MKTRFEYIAYRAEDINESVDFYSKKMGFEVKKNILLDPGKIYAVLLESADGKKVLLISDKGGIDDNTENYHGCWDAASVVQMAEDLVNKGVIIYSAPPFFNITAAVPYKVNKGKCGSYSLFLKDPSGNSIEFHELTEQSLQLLTVKEIEPLLPLININEYVPEAKNQGSPNKE